MPVSPLAVGRPHAARAYAWLVTLSALTVILQGLLFGGFYFYYVFPLKQKQFNPSGLSATITQKST